MKLPWIECESVNDEIRRRFHEVSENPTMDNFDIFKSALFAAYVHKVVKKPNETIVSIYPQPK